MFGGLGFALFRRARAGRRPRRRAARRLLDELVELERTNKDKKRREAILSELETLWGDSTCVTIEKVAKRYGSERALAGVTLELRGGGDERAARPQRRRQDDAARRRVDARAPERRQGLATGRRGKDVAGEDVRREIGMLAHASLCYGELTAVENLELFAGLYDVPTPAPTRLLDRVGLEQKARDRAARTYSRGMLQRLALARALLTRPSLLLLDEPFTGLDRGGALALGEQLGELKAQGTIVVVVTHDLEAIAGRTDHVAILRRGSLVFEERGDAYSYEAAQGPLSSARELMALLRQPPASRGRTCASSCAAARSSRRWSFFGGAAGRDLLVRVPARRARPSRSSVPGMLWVAIAFTGTIALGRAFDRERENDTMRALLLSPVPRLAVFLGKAVAMAALDHGRRDRGRAAARAVSQRAAVRLRRRARAGRAARRDRHRGRSARCSPRRSCKVRSRDVLLAGHPLPAAGPAVRRGHQDAPPPWSRSIPTWRRPGTGSASSESTTPHSWYFPCGSSSPW